MICLMFEEGGKKGGSWSNLLVCLVFYRHITNTVRDTPETSREFVTSNTYNFSCRYMFPVILVSKWPPRSYLSIGLVEKVKFQNLNIWHPSLLKCFTYSICKSGQEYDNLARTVYIAQQTVCFSIFTLSCILRSFGILITYVRIFYAILQGVVCEIRGVFV